MQTAFFSRIGLLAFLLNSSFVASLFASDTGIDNPKSELQDIPLDQFQTIENELESGEEKENSSDDKEFSDWDLDQQLQQDQTELLLNRKGDIRLELGQSYPWQDIGIGMSWQFEKTSHIGVVLSRGVYKIADQRDGFSLSLDILIHSLNTSYRHYFLDYPFYWEIFGGLGFWNGTLTSSGLDAEGKSENTNIRTDFSNYSLSVGGRVGFCWQWDNRFGIDVSIIQASGGGFFDESYTNSSLTARKSVRSQVRGPYFWPSINLAVTYRIED
jgi:hypothetical protein